ncbi:Rps23 Pro-64 3,4-dihydroxylase Tpa1-like proline 4-hydroxylase [Sphingomonas sp. SORGH_AS870]|uniref:2OG-Fe(II) oxygenase n=1 Tax=Sphingomonas sp. SORGH_AS_0870 TaxID=3041801 RepID=UPI00286045E3|nr:2OG-Fe(II) oxygenase [Sphingomonas sp. SORGH_AS_0870]MDR6144215.1 Rps23 Pro-64 3,4-dihydroxylase Tpa1-like proline 4-hydroxylase [Sphingomonas sp. SORGH_AS_0870]
MSDITAEIEGLVNRNTMADFILARLENEKDRIQEMIISSSHGIPYFYIDDVLPLEVTRSIGLAFPAPESMRLKKTIREYKYIAAQMDNYNPILEEAVYAFQDSRIVKLIGEMIGANTLFPDEHLYAGGISLMGEGQYLNPHIDNSHDKDREKWRILNLLFYVSEDWKEENGGNLELWPDGVEGKQITIWSKFNRLAVMGTHDKSWHSVSPIRVNNFRRCVSNYYFSDNPLRDDDNFHVTSFRGRPEQPVIDKILQADTKLRTGIRGILSQGIGNKTHVYRKSD